MRGAPRGLAAIALGILAVLASVAQSTAQSSTRSWPQRAVRLYVPLVPGSRADIGARLMATRLSHRWGQPVVVENRPGGDGAVGIGGFVNARDDHILLFVPASSFTAHPYLYDNLPYQPEDLAPIARVSNIVIALSVPATLPVNSLDELIKLVQAEPGKISWASVTGALDLIFEGYLKSTGLQVSRVEYRSGADAAKDLAEGRVQVYRSIYAVILPRVRAGKAKILAVSNSVRAPAAPGIPTVAEAGYPALTIDDAVGLFGPPGMPMALRERIAADVKAAIGADPAIEKRLTLTGQIVDPGGPAEFGMAIDDQRARVAAAAKVIGIGPKQ